MHFQAFLVDGLTRWNEDRAAAAAPPVAAEEQVGPLHSYSGHLKHVLNQKSQRVLGLPMVKDFTKPAEYTGELIGVEYLYQQTGRVLEVVSLDPDTPDEAAAIESLGEDEDEGIGEDVEAPPSEPSGPAAPLRRASAEAPEDPASTQSSSESEEEMEGPDGQPGYQHVLRLAEALLEARSLLGLSNKRVDRLIVLWNRLPEHDRGRVVYPPRCRERQLKGRFKQGKGINTPFPGKESLQRSLLGPYSGTASWPSASRLVEAICIQLCRLYPSDTRVLGVKRTRWSLVLSDYVAIRAAVLASPRLMAQTDIQLFELNQRTLSKWFSQRQKQQDQAVLLQATGVVPVAALAGEPLPPAKGLSCVQAGQGQPFHFNVPEEQPGPSTTGLPAPPPPPPPSPPPPDGEQPGPSSGGLRDTPRPLLPGPPPPPPPPPPPAPLTVPRTTAYRKRKAAEAAAAGLGPPPGSKPRRQIMQYICRLCGQSKRLETGHTRVGGVAYCATVGGKSVEEWTAERKREMAREPGGPGL
ncbi:hypothetical protein EPR50_G00243810 [Perca flavescens]|uniref:Uncharacterized protein n=2 Tax=Perca flavescens TaxID=8167 RepID=A0A484C4I4_PERFV|nr:hypothetical protein EPR50_G00243810 [Perca flavescens]